MREGEILTQAEQAGERKEQNIKYSAIFWSTYYFCLIFSIVKLLILLFWDSSISYSRPIILILESKIAVLCHVPVTHRQPLQCAKMWSECAKMWSFFSLLSPFPYVPSTPLVPIIKLSRVHLLQRKYTIVLTPHSTKYHFTLYYNKSYNLE